ncbi:MAG: sodium/proton-translocating pyrophosphatase, partial [Candidatus Aminicenantes bacterium]|nr:sodium/proton-translocating pyrophosphatase [Candidatus Aminicenantes bacterium]
MIHMSPFEALALKIVLGIALLGLAYALFLRRSILREDKGTPKMIEVWEAIKQGANAYLTRQLRTILPVIGLLTIALFF